MPELPKRLYRSQTNRVLAGICGGFAEYLNLDPTLIRVLWIFLTIFGGSGIILYIIAYFVIPLNPHQTQAMPSSGGSIQAARIVGAVLVFIGLVVLLDNLDFFHFHRWMRMSWEFLVPVMLIAAG
ncbi:MAG TPA: PspC domain-containing protein, partial [Bacteroidota bacterium]|nr:PspC domain-containing protein [Bacteroidota bacterium]